MMLSLLLLLLLLPSSTAATAVITTTTTSSVEWTSTEDPTTQLVQCICQQTTAYSLCVDALYEDARTPTATHRTTMALIAVELAFLNASSTSSYISELIASSSGGEQAGLLESCQDNYRTAVNVMERAYNDLNSETYYWLADDAEEAEGAVNQCRDGFAGSTWQPLEDRNRVVAVLCEAVAAVGKSLTGGAESC